MLEKYPTTDLGPLHKSLCVFTSTTTHNLSDPLLRRGSYFLTMVKHSYFGRYLEKPEKHKNTGRRCWRKLCSFFFLFIFLSALLGSLFHFQLSLGFKESTFHDTRLQFTRLQLFQGICRWGKIEGFNKFLHRLNFFFAVCIYNLSNLINVALKLVLFFNIFHNFESCLQSIWLVRF